MFPPSLGLKSGPVLTFLLLILCPNSALLSVISVRQRCCPWQRPSVSQNEWPRWPRGRVAHRRGWVTETAADADPAALLWSTCPPARVLHTPPPGPPGAPPPCQALDVRVATPCLWFTSTSRQRAGLSALCSAGAVHAKPSVRWAHRCEALRKSRPLGSLWAALRQRMNTTLGTGSRGVPTAGRRAALHPHLYDQPLGPWR